jgi:hypothetical protein
MVILVWSGGGLPTVTNPHIQTGWLFWFGLVPVTNPYQVPDLGHGLPCVTFTNLYHRDEDTTHSGLDYVSCGVIMYYD